MNVSVQIGDLGKFQVRVAGVIILDNKILLAKVDGNENYQVIGGRLGFGETTEEAVVREVAKEELKRKCTVERLLFINENFFTFKKTQENCHEICYYYLMKPSFPITTTPPPVKESYGMVNFEWVELSKLKDIVLFPEFLKKELQTLPSAPKVVVTKGTGKEA